ncbi:MAG: 3-deoxy-8-phosphooctulonate synthase [Fusobacteriaceae bacterium]|jgi:2-dehydro-3-deoxyphosphooctonate aldolase (KDO 8-P synthase)|nr:3-deoxy-8-phosphooctulonate synthase [Fusobacteriaceae bacterium]
MRTPVKPIKIPGELIIGDESRPFTFIAGPCVIESEALVMDAAAEVSGICKKLGVPYIFKASFDKANRTSIHSFRGPGLEKGLEILAKVKKTFGIPIVTDVHEPAQCAPVGEICDMLQIPAFLCRQTDLLVAAARTGKPVNVKKGQFLAPWDMKNVAGKLQEAGCRDILLCERGSSFGYNNLVVDMRSLLEMRKLGHPVVFDATHAVQKPGGLGSATGGDREYVRPLIMAALAVGVDAVFAEVHPDPERALSDGPNMLYIRDLEEILTEALQIDQISKNR